MMNDNTKTTIQTKLANEFNVWIRMNSTNTINEQNHIDNSSQLRKLIEMYKINTKT